MIEYPSRWVKGVKSLFIYIGHKYLGEKITEVGGMLRIRQSVASMAMKKGGNS